MTEDAGLVIAQIDQALDATTDVREVNKLDAVLDAAKRYAEEHGQRIDWTVAKLKTARRGGQLLIGMAARGERATSGVHTRQESRRATLGDFGITKSRSARWQIIGRMPDEDFGERVAAILAEDEDASLAVQAMGGLKATTGVEWYTPAKYIAAAREVMGAIDLDPASSALANKTVRAKSYYDAEFDALRDEVEWHGRVWLNPPYGKLTGQFVTKLVEERNAGRVSQAVLLLNAYGFDADWFQPLWEHVLCFTDHRIIFTSPQRETGGPANGNLFVYLGDQEATFAGVFERFGAIVRRWQP